MKLQGGHCRPISVRMSTASEARGCTEDSNSQVRRKDHVREREREKMNVGGYPRHLVGAYLSSPGDSSSGPNTTNPRVPCSSVLCVAIELSDPWGTHTKTSWNMIGHECTRARKKLGFFYRGGEEGCNGTLIDLFPSLFPLHPHSLSCIFLFYIFF